MNTFSLILKYKNSFKMKKKKKMVETSYLKKQRMEDILQILMNTQKLEHVQQYFTNMGIKYNILK